MKKNNTKGFKINIDGILYHVYFQEFNSKVVKCMIIAGDKIFTAISKCNFSEGDVFDLKEGQRIALEKALTKLCNSQIKSNEIAQDKEYRRIYNADKVLKNRLDKMWRKAAKKAKKKELPLEELQETYPGYSKKEYENKLGKDSETKVDPLDELCANCD